MSEQVRNIVIDDRIEAYEGYIPDGWAERAFAAAPTGSKLEALTMDLMMAWRTTAYAASVPGMLPKSICNVLHGYAGATARDSDLVMLGESVLKRVSQKVPELVENQSLRARLMEELVKTADEFRAVGATVKPDFPPADMWREFLKEHVFVMSVWSLQRIAYVAFYNAYEAFLVDCLKVGMGTDQLRTTDKKPFNDALRAALGQDISTPCWTHHEINNARLVRHALSHAGGRVTADLKKQKHGVREQDGVLQLFPEDLKKMLDRLRRAVEVAVVAAAGRPEFTASHAVV